MPVSLPTEFVMRHVWLRNSQPDANGRRWGRATIEPKVAWTQLPVEKLCYGSHSEGMYQVSPYHGWVSSRTSSWITGSKTGTDEALLCYLISMPPIIRANATISVMHLMISLAWSYLTSWRNRSILPELPGMSRILFRNERNLALNNWKLQTKPTISWRGWNLTSPFLFSYY